MKKLIALFVLISQFYYTQNVAQNLDAAAKKMLSSSPAYAANLSFYVADEEGNFIYEMNGNKGLSTASTQKIFTAATALDVLGKDFQYVTTANYSGKLSDGLLNGNLYIHSTGDPTLGSWRYDGFKPEDFKKQLIAALKAQNINKISGDIIVNDSYFDFQTIPGGWPWNDLGNYYGAGVWGVNWRENQFDMQVTQGNIKKLNVNLPGVKWVNELKTGGSSDQSLIFTAPHSEAAYINGTLPNKTMTVSGATPNPPLTLGDEISVWLKDWELNLMVK